VKALIERARAAGAKRAEAAAQRIADGLLAPGIFVTVHGTDVVLSGRGLWRRMLTDVRLRAIGLWVRSGQ
jgi:hypothetical protein